jgi:hypothetical protein
VEVKHFIACVDTLRILPLNPQRTLLHDVRFSYHLEPDAVTPFFLDKVVFFTRFYGAIGSHCFRIQTLWHDSSGHALQLRGSKSKPVEFDPTRFVEDHNFAVYEIRVPGPGLLEFRLTRVDQPEIILGVEYLEVRYP